MMLQSKLHIQKMLFNYETTYNSDYRHGEIREYPKTVYKPKAESVTQPTRTLYKAVKNLHTMSEWKGEVPPFSLMHVHKDIVRTSPFTVPKPFLQKEDVDKETAIKTRPRLVMTPAVSMDDIADPVAREILVTDMYTSEMSRQTKAATAALPAKKHVKAPLPVLPAPANPVRLPKLQPPYVSPEWRMETMSWDGKQLRAHCDPTADFWRARDATKYLTLAFVDPNRYMDMMLDTGVKILQNS